MCFCTSVECLRSDKDAARSVGVGSWMEIVSPMGLARRKWCEQFTAPDGKRACLSVCDSNAREVRNTLETKISSLVFTDLEIRQGGIPGWSDVWWKRVPCCEEKSPGFSTDPHDARPSFS